MTSTSSATTSSIKHDPPSVNEYEQPSNKKVKFEDQQRGRHEEVTWVDQLYVEAAEEAQELDILSAMDETMEFLRIEIDAEPPSSRRQQKLLDRNHCAYLVKKMRDSEVRIANLPPHERELFSRAKLKEVSSFLSNEAARKCLDQKEIADAYNSQRIVKVRWVLTWKLVPPEDKKGAVEDAKTNPNTLHSKGGEKKAKARIVLLGFQHPNLLDRNFKTASPVQPTMGRNLLYLMASQHQWKLEGLDLATAFLQTQPTEADERLWTTGVEELRTALGVGPEGIMRILRNIYGSTTAPRSHGWPRRRFPQNW